MWRRIRFHRLGVMCGVGSAAVAVAIGCANKWTTHCDTTRISDEITAQYENRIRGLSSPEKIFRTFATVWEGQSQFMTPQDFLRSLESHIPKNSSRRNEMSNAESQLVQLIDTNSDGLISFGEYLFLCTMLCLTETNLELSFKTFDRELKGALNREEFEALLHATRMQLPWGQLIRTPESQRSFHAPPLLFGNEGKETVTFDGLKNCVTKLHNAVLRLQFENVDQSGSGTISMREFGDVILSSASPTLKRKFEKRLRQLDQRTERISFEQFTAFHQMLRAYDAIKQSVLLLSQTDCIDQPAIQHASRAIAGIQLEPYVVSVLFELLDDDGNGCLSPDELVSILESRAFWGLKNSRSLGMSELFECSRQCYNRTRK